MWLSGRDSRNVTYTVKARLHIGEATSRFLFVSLCRLERFARISAKLSEMLSTK